MTRQRLVLPTSKRFYYIKKRQMIRSRLDVSMNIRRRVIDAKPDILSLYQGSKVVYATDKRESFLADRNGSRAAG